MQAWGGLWEGEKFPSGATYTYPYPLNVQNKRAHAAAVTLISHFGGLRWENSMNVEFCWEISGYIANLVTYSTPVVIYNASYGKVVHIFYEPGQLNFCIWQHKYRVKYDVLKVFSGKPRFALRNHSFLLVKTSFNIWGHFWI